MEITADDFKNLLFEVYLLQREVAALREALKQAQAEKAGDE